MESLSTELACPIQCAYTPQRGDDFDRTLHEMADKLSAAFGETPRQL
jgi:hypothetical protein